MFRHIGGGWLLLGLLCTFRPASAQISLVGADNGLPVKDAVVRFSAASGASETAFTSDDGVAAWPAFDVNYVVVYATGFQPLQDTVNGIRQKRYSLVPLKVQMDEVVITGQYHPNEASASVYDVQVFDRKNIELRAANNLSDLLQYENSILISRDPFLGAGININGVSGNNVKILQDGVPVIGRENGNIDISQLDLSNVERVELVRGPMSETYGSDALAGVINLVSKKRQHDGVSANGKLYYESNGTYNAGAGASARKKKHEVSIHFGHNFFDGYSQKDTSRAQLWKPKEQYLGDLGYALRFSKGYFRYQGSAAHERLINKGNIIATPYEAYAFDDYYSTFRMSHKLFADIETGKHTSLNFTNAFSNYERSLKSFRKDMVNLKQSDLSGNNYTNLFRQYLFRGTYSTYRSWKKINFQAGYDITLDEARGDRTGSVTRRMNDYAFFGSAEYTPVKSLLIRPAMRVIVNSAYHAPLVPSIHVKFDPAKYLSFRASFARGFRAPSVKELYLDFEDSNHNLKGNTRLKPELSNYAHFGADLHGNIKSFRWSVEPGVYYNHIYNKISLAQINSNALEYTYINIDDFRSYGGELQAWIERGPVKIQGGINPAAYRNNLHDVASTPYRHTLNYNGSFTFSAAKCGVSMGLFYKHFGRVTVYAVENNTVVPYSVNGYNTLDFTLSKSLFRKTLVLSAGIKNIFNNITTKGNPDTGDVHGGSEQDQALTGMGRFYFGGIQLNIGKN